MQVTGLGGGQVGEKGFLADRRELEKVTHKEDIKTTKVAVPGAGEDLPTPLLDPQEHVKPDHGLLVDNEVAHV